MKAIILCAGYGNRLGELTKNRPKPLIEVAGKPVIEYIITRMNDSGITDIMVNVHYLSEMITDYLKDRVKYYYEPELLGHKGTIKALKSWLENEESFLVANGDTLNELHYQSFIKAHKPKSITVYMDEWRCCGTWIYPKEYFTDKDLPVYPYRDYSKWFDIGLPDRLAYARGYYDAKSTYSMSGMRQEGKTSDISRD